MMTKLMELWFGFSDDGVVNSSKTKSEKSLVYI
jgi:hypothetical protein